MVSAPVVNCSCNSSSRAAGRTSRRTSPASSSACGSEAKARPWSICDVERLDAERIASQRHGALGAFVDGDGEHAAKLLGVVGAVAQPQIQRRLAVAVGGERHAGHGGAQLPVIVDLAIADQRRRAGEQRLVAGDEVDDRQPVMHQSDAADDGVAGAVRATVVQAVDQLRQGGGIGGRRAARQDQSGNAAHSDSNLQQQVFQGG
jgi:hypothetical protein